MMRRKGDGDTPGEEERWKGRAWQDIELLTAVHGVTVEMNLQEKIRKNEWRR